jgi:hypothetical protein
MISTKETVTVKELLEQKEIYNKILNKLIL